MHCESSSLVETVSRLTLRSRTSREVFSGFEVVQDAVDPTFSYVY
uniref:Uncharacterized protein n=1 Tax=Rhizophora mucronata TaxID=61149 RepID=A0A2P2PFL2_RHIMU